MTKVPTPAGMSKGQSDNTNKATKSSVTQRLRTDLGRSVGVYTTIQLVWLTGLRAQPFHSPQQPCNQKDKKLEIILFKKKPGKQKRVNKQIFHRVMSRRAFPAKLLANYQAIYNNQGLQISAVFVCLLCNKFVSRTFYLDISTFLMLSKKHKLYQSIIECHPLL